MSYSPTLFESIDDVQHWILRAILDDGRLVSPRKIRTRELIGVGFSISNPRRRCVASRARRFSLPLAVGEFSWHLQKSDEVAALAYYAKRWSDFSTDGNRITASCYGRKIFDRNGQALSQWENVLNVLRSDADSRRAMLSLWTPEDASPDSVDVSCTCTIQFLIRESRLHTVVHMRSNDAIWGVPYDVFLFTMLQEYLAAQLQLNLGTYTHFVGSLHLYERHFALAERILGEPVTSFEMPKMAPIESMEEFLDTEKRIRTGWADDVTVDSLQSIPSYWRHLAEVLVWFRRRRDTNVEITLSPDNCYSELLRRSLSRQAPAA